MTIRRIYRWENPGETLKYLVTYYTLWLFNLVLPGFVSFILLLIRGITERKAFGCHFLDPAS